MDRYEIVSKDTYHMFALGEVVVRHGKARILDTYVYVNERGIMQRLTDNQVKLLVDKEPEQA